MRLLPPAFDGSIENIPSANAKNIALLVEAVPTGKTSVEMVAVFLGALESPATFMARRIDISSHGHQPHRVIAGSTCPAKGNPA